MNNELKSDNKPGGPLNPTDASLQIYNIYRLLQLSALILYFFFFSANSYLGKQNPTLFILTASAYFLFCLLALLQSRVKTMPRIGNNGVLFLLLVDIVAITAFIHFSGGIHGSLGILLVVVVATAGILLQGRLVLFVAAMASLAILSVQIYQFYNLQADADKFVQTGILGFALFGVALIVQQVATRLRDSERLVFVQAEQVETLEKINERIIEQLPNGVIVIDHKLQLKFMNTAAWRMLHMPSVPDASPLEDISRELHLQVKAWLRNPAAKLNSFTPRQSGSDLKAAFIDLGGGQPESAILIYLDDASLMSEQAQKLKLASLGTLTAGIAHEIRNPLGAISHAAQLLKESEQLGPADIRLAEIIQQHSVRMNRIIENVLQLSRQKAGKVENIVLNDWLKIFVEDFKNSHSYPLEMVLTLSAQEKIIHADSSQLAQVLTNLCENGLRYSYSNSGQYYIRITSSYDASNHHSFIDIIDRGPGIPANEVEHIFEPFYTTDSKGSGLGLYIAKELCENNRSKLDYIPVPIGGSCFRITFLQ